MSAPVLVAVDGTEDGRRALRYGVGLARAWGAPLRLVHVRHQDVVLAPTLTLFPDGTLTDIAERVLERAAQYAVRLGWSDDLETTLAHGTRVEGIVDHTHDARAVVLGTRSPSPGRLLTGSTSEGVAAHCTVPVFCVPTAWDPDARFHRVSVGVDATAAALPLMRAAASLAEVLDSTVVVVHAWRPVGQYDATIGAHGYDEVWRSETIPRVERFVEPVRADHPQVKIEVELHWERPIGSLHALSQHSDLVVVGRHTRHGRFTPLLGGTARAVIRTSACPVMVVPS